MGKFEKLLTEDPSLWMFVLVSLWVCVLVFYVCGVY